MGLGHPVGHQGIGSGVNCRGNGSAEWDRMWRGTERSHGGRCSSEDGNNGPDDSAWGGISRANF